MANSTVSQRPKITSVKEEDLLLVSQKQPNDSFLTCSMEAKEIMGKSAYASWLENKTTLENYFTDNNTYQIYQSINNNNPPVINQFLNTYNLGDSYNTYVDNKLYNNSTNLNEYINNNNYQNQLFQYKLQNVTEATNLKSFVTSNNNILNQYTDYFKDYKSSNIQYIKEFVNQNNYSQLYENYVINNIANTLQSFKLFVSNNNLKNQFNSDIISKKASLLSTLQEFVFRNLSTQYSTYIINKKASLLSTLQEFISNTLSSQYEAYILHDKSANLPHIKAFISNDNLTGQFETYIINKKSNNLSTLREFIIANDLEDEYTSYIENNSSGDFATDYNRFITDSNLRVEFNSFIVDGSTLLDYIDFIDSSNNRANFNNYTVESSSAEEYNNYIDYSNNRGNYNSYITLNSSVEDYNDFIDSSNNRNNYNTYITTNGTLQDYNDFVDDSNLRAAYNSYTVINSGINDYLDFLRDENIYAEYLDWLNSNPLIYNYKDLNEFVIENNYSNQYQQYLTNVNNTQILKTDETSILYNFIKHIDEVNEYKAFVDQKNIIVTIQQFLEQLKGDEFYENYLKNNTISLQDFTELLNIQESYQNWVQEQLLLLKEDQFLQDLKGVSGTGSVLNKYTEVWLSVSGVYVNPVVDPNNPPDPAPQKPLKFGVLVIPERTFIKFDRIHRMYSSKDNISITMNGPFKKQLPDGQFEGFSEFLISSNNTVASFEPEMFPEDVVVLEAGSVVQFSFLEQPEPENMTTVALTIMARKVRSYSSSVNALRLQGSWGFKDSIIGDATIKKDNGEIIKGYWADIDHVFGDWNWFNTDTRATRSFKDVYACTVQTADIEHIVSFNNTSKIRRVLTLTPFQSLDSDRRGMFVGDKNKLPINCILKENGELEIILEGWED